MLSAHRALIGALCLAASVQACASRESIGTRSVSILGAGVVNDPKNKSLRFDLLKFGLDRFCNDMRASGVPLKMNDDEPVMGRFHASACNTQIIDEPTRKTFVVQYAGEGFATSPQGGRIGFSTSGLVEYAPDFLLHDGSMYVYFRPKVVDATAFQMLLVESQLADNALRLLGVSPDAFGRKVVDAELRRGFTVVRYNEAGETEFATGVVPLGQRPYHPFSVKTEDKRVLANERTEVHLGQQDYIGPLGVDDDDQALYLTLALDGAAAADALLVPEAGGRAMLEKFTRNPGPASLAGAATLDEPIVQGQLWKRYAVVPKGKYYVLLDNSGAVGRTTPPPGPSDGRSARIDVLVLVGERP